MIRIMVCDAGYEVWCGSYHVCTCASRQAAQDEVKYLMEACDAAS